MAATTRKRPPTGEGLTFEKVWAMFQETDLKIKEVAEQQKENAEQQRENARLMEERDKRLDKQIGKLGNRFGELVEHLVAPNIKEKFNELGFRFTRTAMDVEIEDPEDPEGSTEVDVLLENGDIAVAVEVKSKPNDKDVNDHIRRMRILRRNADKKQDKRRYQGAIAGAVMSKEIRRYILKKGFYIIEQTGDTVQITIPRGFKAREW
jgi:hypothetical protein